MNREMRRLQAREERRNKKGEENKKTPGRQAPQKKDESLNFFQRVAKFLREVRVELSRVSWPTRQQMIAFTTVTLITTVALTAFIFLIDLGFRQGVFSLLDLFS